MEVREEKRPYCIIALSTGLNTVKRHSKYVCYVIEKINSIHHLYPEWSLLGSYIERTPAFPPEMVVPLHTQLGRILFAAAFLNIKCAIHPSQSSPYQSYTITLFDSDILLKANQCELAISQIRSSTQVQMSWPLITLHHWPKFETTRSHFSLGWHPERHHLSGDLPCIFFFSFHCFTELTKAILNKLLNTDISSFVANIIGKWCINEASFTLPGLPFLFFCFWSFCDVLQVNPMHNVRVAMLFA